MPKFEFSYSLNDRYNAVVEAPTEALALETLKHHYDPDRTDPTLYPIEFCGTYEDGVERTISSIVLEDSWIE